jgi:hypothetical protein
MFLPPGSASSTTLIVKRPLSKNGAQRPRESQKIHRPRPRVRPMQPRGLLYVNKCAVFDIYCHKSEKNGTAARHNKARINFNKSGRSFNKSGTCSDAPRARSNAARDPLFSVER